MLALKDVVGSPNSVFQHAHQVVMEGFEDGALVLRPSDRRVLELNPTGQAIFAQTDGRRSAGEIAASLAETYQVPVAEVEQDVLTLYQQLSRVGIVQLIDHEQEAKENAIVTEASATNRRYVRNPDVVLREEEEEGGLLFDPDTNQVKVVNTTGLFLWKQFDGSRDLDEIVANLKQAFEGAPAEEVTKDVQDFVEAMASSGFLGTAETV